MKTLIMENTAVFTNPFLNMSEELLLEISGYTDAAYGQREIVTLHNFDIVSATPNGQRYIFWSKYNSNSDNAARVLFRMEKPWDKIYVWDSGAASLKKNDEGDRVFLEIEYGITCENPNLIISRPFLLETLKGLESQGKQFENFPIVNISYSLLDISSLEERLDWLRIFEKNQWLKNN